MKMKFKNICVGALAALAMASCDLDTAPTSSIDAGNVYTSTSRAESVLRGAGTTYSIPVEPTLRWASACK